MFGDDGDPLAHEEPEPQDLDDLEAGDSGAEDDALDGGAGDESEDLADGLGGEAGDSDQQQGAAPLAQPRRSKEENFGALRRQLKAEKAERERLDNEFREFRMRQAQPDPHKAAEERAARLALMGPEERAAYLVDETRQESDRKFAALEFRMADSADRSAFASLAATNKLYARVADKVEAELAMARRGGVNLPREVLAQKLIGEMAVKSVARTGAKQKAGAAARVQRQQAQPPNPNGTQGQGNRRALNEREARRKRLENVTF